MKRSRPSDRRIGWPHRRIGWLAACFLPVLASCISFERPLVSVPEASVTQDSGLRYVDVFVGDGEPVSEGDQVTFDYTLLLADGTRVDSTLDRGVPLSLRLGEAPLPGLNHGLVGMRPGGRRRLELPPELAYGETGVPGLVPPGAALVAEIHLLEAEP